jgi:tetratricopeptide (TPR) repeat protein
MGNKMKNKLMKNFKNFVIGGVVKLRFSLLLGALMFTSFAQAQIEVGHWNNGNFSVTKTYTPVPSTQQDNSLFISKINKDLKEVVKILPLVKAEPKTWLECSAEHIKNVTASDEEIEAKECFGILYYHDIIIPQKIRVEKITIKGYSESGDFGDVTFPVNAVKMKGSNSGEFRNSIINEITFRFSSPETARDFAENMYYLLLPYDKQLLAFNQARAADSIQFSISATKYRELQEKPPVTEEQRKYIVQANSMNERKDYTNAIQLFRKVIEINPTSYPAAYFNLALISALTRDYRYAIYNMRKYLLLVPDAPDARTAQDKIYEWEYEIE